MKVFIKTFLLYFFIDQFIFCLTLTNLPCDLRKTQYGSVCVCNSTYCDYISDVNPKGLNEFILVSSSKKEPVTCCGNEQSGFVIINFGNEWARDLFENDYVKLENNLVSWKPKRCRELILNLSYLQEFKSKCSGGLRYSKKTGEFTKNNQKNIQFFIEDYDNNKNDLKLKTIFTPTVILREKRLTDYNIEIRARDSQSQIKIDRNITFQKIIGFGGAFTGAVSHNLNKLSNELQNHIYRSYFSEIDGIGYNFLRMSIGGCDFDLAPWAYNEEPKNDPNLSNFTSLDLRDLKKIEQIQQLKEISNNYNIKLMGSAWSPPPWMKSNNDWTGLSSLKKEYYKTWATYHIRFLELMDAKNMSFWAITTGNEPLNGVIGWFFVHFMSLGWMPQNQGIWLGEDLGPALRNSKFKNVKIFGNDDQRYTFPLWFKRMESKKKDSTSYLDGLAVHWYWDNIFGPNLLDKAHELYPEKMILNTESCVGDKPFQTHGPELGSWERGEKYAKSYIQDLQHWVNGWIDWNIILDEQGGPNYVNNHVDAPIIVNTTSGQEIYKQPIFYVIGHFSKFIPKGSVRIQSQGYNTDMENVAFLRPDNSIAVIFLNSKKTSVNVIISDSERGKIIIEIPEKSMHTIIYN